MGLLIVNIIILLIGTILLAVGSGFGANAATKVAEIPNYTDNPDLNTAHTYLSAGSIVGWITVVILIITGILTLIFASKGGTWKTIVTVLLFLVAITSIIIGVLFVIAAGKIDGSGATFPNGSPAGGARTGGWMAIGSGIAVIIAAIIVILIRKKSPTQQKIETQEAELAAKQADLRRQAIALKQQEALDAYATKLAAKETEAALVKSSGLPTV